MLHCYIFCLFHWSNRIVNQLVIRINMYMHVIYFNRGGRHQQHWHFIIIYSVNACNATVFTTPLNFTIVVHCDIPCRVLKCVVCYVYTRDILFTPFLLWKLTRQCTHVGSWFDFRVFLHWCQLGLCSYLPIDGGKYGSIRFFS